MTHYDERCLALEASFDTNVFVSMRYLEGAKFRKIEDCVRSVLRTYGLQPLMAKDAPLHLELWSSVELYMTYCKYGIFVFEQLEGHDFNANVAMELGYMLALRRTCLLLQEQRMTELPVNIRGKIVQHFDSDSVARSLKSQIKKWCEDDLRLRLMASESVSNWVGSGVESAGGVRTQTELEKRIAVEVNTNLLPTPKSFPFGKRVRVVSHTRETDASEYILWNEVDRKLSKYSRAGGWDGPFRLADSDEEYVSKLLFRRNEIEMGNDLLTRLEREMSDGLESEALRKFRLYCEHLYGPNYVTPAHIFCSTTYGGAVGISPQQGRILARRGLISYDGEDGRVSLTAEGKNTWEALHFKSREQPEPA